MIRLVTALAAAVLLPYFAFAESSSLINDEAETCRKLMRNGRLTIEPKAEKRPFLMRNHDHTRKDPYYWMNEKDSPEVLAQVAAENDYADMVFNDPTKALQEELFQEIKGRIKLDDQSAPVRRDDFYYYSRNEADQDYRIHARRKGSLTAEEEVVLDENELAKGLEYSKLGQLAVSPDHKYLAFSHDVVSRRIYHLKLKDLKTGEIRELGVPDGAGALVWAEDSETLYYTTRDTETLIENRVWQMNVKTGEKKEIYFEPDEEFHLSIGKSNSRNFIFVGSHQTMTSEFRVMAADGSGELKVMRPRQEGVLYYPEDSGTGFYFLTNEGGATNFKVMAGSYEKPEAWQEIIAHNPDIYIEDLQPTQDRLVLEQRQGGYTDIVIFDPVSQESKKIQFEDSSYVAGINSVVDYKRNLLRYEYETMARPFRQYDMDVTTGDKDMVKESEIMGGFDPKAYETRRIMVTARDGVQVPVSLVYKKGTELKAAPTLQYAYGSYGHTVDPAFSSSRLTLLDRGFVFVISHIRGGAMMGRPWYEDGKLLKKMNTFNDFIDVGQHLVDSGITAKGQLFGMGGSAGGLLMGAVANMAPEGLYKGLVAQVPFVDVVTTMLDDSIPLTTFEYDEWGNPNEQKFYEYMLQYSPVDNVAAQNYPHMLVTTGYHDSQVQYWEPLKWVAKLREYRTNKNLLLLDTNMDSGHGGASGRFDSLRELAQEYAFILTVLNLD